MTLAIDWAAARDFAFWALICGALVLSGMLGAGGAAFLARGRVEDAGRRRVAGAAVLLWLISSAALIALAALYWPEKRHAMALGAALALFRLAIALRFDLRFARPKGADLALLLRAGFRPLAASALLVAAALLSGSLIAAALCAALLLAANVAVERDAPEKLRAAGRLTALAVMMAVPLAFLPNRAGALGALAVTWLAVVALTAGFSALLHLPTALYEAYLPARARWIRRRSGR
jgi:hypothetical protein